MQVSFRLGSSAHGFVCHFFPPTCFPDEYLYKDFGGFLLDIERRYTVPFVKGSILLVCLFFSPCAIGFGRILLGKRLGRVSVCFVVQLECLHVWILHVHDVSGYPWVSKLWGIDNVIRFIPKRWGYQ